MHSWIRAEADAIAQRAMRELEALVGVSSPSGDVAGAEECAAICAALLPADAAVERPACSSPGHAPDLLARVAGTGTRRILLLGHLDTVVAHGHHKPLRRDGAHLVGSGAVDMKGGGVLALGACRALAARRGDFAEAALLLVCDEEWRTAAFGPLDRFAGWDARPCFQAGGPTPPGPPGVRAAHSGSAPDRGRNALLALAAASQAVAACHAPDGPDRLTAVPTVLHAGDAFNVVPGRGELICDLRADSERPIVGVLDAIPRDVGGVALEPELASLWPGMDAGAATAALLERATAALGRQVRGVWRGGASDASHLAGAIPLTVDGLGPRGGKAHNPGEFVLADSLRSRAEVALAVLDAVLA